MTDIDRSFGAFFLPGPTDVRPEILQALARPMISHRGKDFGELFERVQLGLKKVFFTERPVFVSTSSATGLMEGGIRCAPAGRVLSLVNGAFSERFAQIAEKCGRAVDRYVVDWGETHDVGEVERRLQANRYAVVTVVHSETSTGALNDIRSISDAAHRSGVPCLVDSVSGAGGAEVRFDAWGLDYLLTGSQKAFALPPGLAFGIASDGFMASAKKAESRGVYFDLVEYEEFVGRGQAPNTPAVSLWFALEAQLHAIHREGIEARWARHSAMAQEVYGWLDRSVDRGISALAAAGRRSPTTTTIVLPKGLSTSEFARRVRERGIIVGPGYGKLKETTFRIGHMGDHTVETVRGCTAACDAALRELLGA
jgi:aspartate aminotransferase-like enzyme